MTTEYKYGFTTEIETESIPKGLSEETIRLISAKKKEPSFLLDLGRGFDYSVTPRSSLLERAVSVEG